MFDLFRETVVRYAEDVFESVVARDWDVAPVWLEVDRPRDAKFCERKHTKVSAPKNPEFSLTLVCDGEIKGEVFGISRVVLQEYEALV